MVSLFGDTCGGEAEVFGDLGEGGVVGPSFDVVAWVAEGVVADAAGCFPGEVGAGTAWASSEEVSEVVGAVAGAEGVGQAGQ